MQSDSAVLRLKAWAGGKPYPRYDTKHVVIQQPSNVLVLAFVRMAGESSPWGISIGHPGESPKISTVAEPRNRDFVAQMVADLSDVLLEHFESSIGGVNRPGQAATTPLRQIWVPNPTHVDMLHHLAYAYTFAKWGVPARASKLRNVGRLSGWLFREAHRPGQMTVLVATDVLRQAYAFPSDPVREAHLGYLLAWLETRGNRETRLVAAARAERASIATTLDPSFEREELEGVVEKWGTAKKAEQSGRMNALARAIEKTLKPELLRRAELTVRALEFLQRDARATNMGVAKLAQESQQEHWYQYARHEAAPAYRSPLTWGSSNQGEANDGPAFVSSPETDRFPAAAASRYFVNQASEEFRIASLIHHDPKLQLDAIAIGDAVKGKIGTVVDEGAGRKSIPVWRLECEHYSPLRIREGTDLCVAELPSRIVHVRRIDWTSPTTVTLEVEITSLKTVPHKPSAIVVKPAADNYYVGREVTLLPISREGIPRRKMQRVWNRETPGGWLTHSKPGGVGMDLPAEVAEELAVISEFGVP